MRKAATAIFHRPPAPVLTDPTIYPVEERVGEDILQRWILELLRPLVASWLASRGVRAFVGADQFVYYKQFDAHSRCSPDILVIPGLAPDHRVRSWKTWEHGRAPTFVLEVVSRDVDKDYYTAPERYDAMGASELVIFDPDHETSEERTRFQVYRRLPRRGWTRTVVTNADRVASKVLGCWLRVVGSGVEMRLRVGTGARGEILFPTDAERAEHASEQAQRERGEKEREREDATRERAGRLAAEARVAELEAQLRRRKR